MPVLRVDDEVWVWLQRNAKPFEDTPNSVLRRVAGLDSAQDRRARSVPVKSAKRSQINRRQRSNTGRALNNTWKVGARHALYHIDGSYYNHLRQFPGALFDSRGYLLFKTERDYRESPYLQHGQQLHVPGGISSVPGYVKMSST